METPKLSPVERRLLLNQLKLMASTLNIDNDAAGYSRLATIVEEGYEQEYGSLFTGFDEAVSVEECRFVIDVLEMYSQLQYGFDAAADKNGLKASDVAFPGFDGNNACRWLAYAQFLRKDGRWQNLRVGSDDLNSHGSGDHLYPEMRGRFKALRRTYELSIEEKCRRCWASKESPLVLGLRSSRYTTLGQRLRSLTAARFVRDNP